MEKNLQDILESDANFRSQFDRNSETFHKGDPTPVPLGGQRVPEGALESAETPAEESKVISDPRYDRVMSSRSFLQDYKKTVSLICPAVELRLRAKGHKSGEDREKQLKESQDKIEEVLGKIREGEEKLREMRDLIGDYSEELQFIYSNSLTDYSTKEEYGDFMLRVGNFTKKIFKDISNLLQLIKDIKKGKT